MMPGEPVDKVQVFQEDAEEQLFRMLNALTYTGIWPDDLHSGNVMYDYKTNQFYPIDMGTSSTQHADSHQYDESSELNEDTCQRLEEISTILKQIRKVQKTSKNERQHADRSWLRRALYYCCNYSYTIQE